MDHCFEAVTGRDPVERAKEETGKYICREVLPLRARGSSSAGGRPTCGYRCTNGACTRA